MQKRKANTSLFYFLTAARGCRALSSAGLFGLFLPALLLLSLGAVAQNANTIASGNWSNPAIWQDNLVPAASNDVFINSGHTVTLDLAVSIDKSVNVAGGGILNLAGFNLTAGYISGNGTIRSSSGTPTLTVGGSNEASFSFGGVIGTGALNLVKTGTGVLSLAGSNSYTGTTTINNGAIRLLSPSGLGTTGAVTVNSGGRLQLEGPFVLSKNITLNGNGNGSEGALHNISGANEITTTLNLGSASTITAASGTLTLSAATSLATATFAVTLGGAANLQINGILSGSGTLTKEGNGVVSLLGANTHSGNKTINGGSLNLQNNSALGSAGTVTVNSGAAIQLQGGINISRPITVNGTGVSSSGAIQNIAGDNTLSATLTLGSASRIESNGGSLTLSAATSVSATNLNLTLAGSATTTISGVLALGSGQLLKEEGGTLILSGTNTYTGGTNINAGALNIRSAAALGASGTIQVASGAALQLENNITLARNVSINGSGQSNTGAIRSLSGSNTISATITLSGAARIQAESGSTLTLSAANAVNSSNLALSLGGAGTINASGTFTIGTAALTKTGSGTTTISVANNYSGGTTINEGILIPTNMSALGTSGTVTISGSGTLQLSGGVTFARPINLASAGNGNIGGIRSISGNNTLSGLITLTGNGRINADANLLTLNNANALTGTTATISFGGSGNITINRAITTTSGGLTKDGSGTLTLNVACSYTGTTTVIAGTLVLGASNILADASNLTVTGGTLNIGAFNETVNLFSVNGGTVSGTGTINSLNDYSFSGTATININLGGNVGLVKLGGGTTTLTGANTFTGQVWIQNGTLSVSSLNRIVGGSPSSNLGAPTTAVNGMIRFGNGSQDGTLLYTGTGESSDRMFELAGGNGGNGTIQNNGSGPLQLSGHVVSDAVGTSTLFLRGTNTGNNIFSGEIEENVGTGTTAFQKLDAGTWILTRANGFGGNVAVGGGILRIEADGALGQGSSLSVSGTTSLHLAPTVGNITINHNVSLSGNGISNLGIVRNLNGNNVFNGTVSLSGTTTIFSDQDSLLYLGNPSIRSNNDASGRTLTLHGVGHHRIQNDWNTGTSATFSKNGSGTLVLNGQRLTTGTFNVFAGLVIMGAADRLNNGTMIDNDAVVDMNGFNLRVERIQGNSTGRFQSNVAGSCTLTVENNSGNLSTYSGQINDGSGTVWFRKEGTGGQVINNTACNYSGGTYIEGLLRVTSLNNSGTNSSIGQGTASPTIVINNGILEYNSTTGRSTNRPLSLTGTGTLNQINSGVITYNGNVTGTNQNLVLQANSSRTGIINGIINLGNGTLTKENAGTWELAGVNVYSGTTTISAGELRIGNAAAIPTSSAVVNNATLNLNGFSITMSSLSGSDTTAELRSNVAGAVNVTFSNSSGDFTYAGRILNGSGTVSITKGGAYTQRLGGNNSYTGTTTINGGVLKAVSATAISSASAFTIANTAGATLDIQGFNNTIGSLAGGGTTGGNVLLGTATLSIGGDNTSTSYSGTITGTGTGGIEKVGTGTFTFAGTADYVGLTRVSNGTFRAGAALVFDGVVSISTGATFNCNGFQSSCFYLSFNNLRQVSGSWGYTGSGATNINTTYFTNNTGRLIAIDGITNGYWLGTTSTDWFTASNWHNNHIPQDTTRAVIEYVAINAPTINGTATCRNLEIFPAAIVTMSGSSVIDVHGDWLNYGSFVPASSTVNFRKPTGTALAITRPSVGPFANLQYFGTGTLRLSSNQPLPFQMSGSLLTNTGNTIDLNGKGLNCAGLGGPGLITNSQPFDVVIAIDGSTDRTFSGTIQNGSGSVGITKTGSMTQILEGNNTFTGGITVNGGTLHARNSTTSLGNGSVTLAGTAPVLRLSNTAGVGLNFNRPITINAAAEIISDNNSTGAGATHTLGTLSLNAANLTISGGANVNSGTAGINFGAVTHSVSPTYTVNNPTGGGITQLSLGATTGGNFPVVMNGNGNIVQSGAFNIQPATAAESAITYSGTGTLTLSQNNTMTQRLTISSGLVVATANGNALGSATTVYMSGGFLSLRNNTPLAFNNNVITTVNATIFSDLLTAGAGVSHSLGNLNLNSPSDSIRILAGSNVNSGLAGVVFGQLTLATTTNFQVDTLAMLQMSSFVGTSRVINKYGAGELRITADGNRTSTTNMYEGRLRLESANAVGTNATADFNFYGGTLALAANSNTSFNGTDLILRGNSQTISIDRTAAAATAMVHTVNTLSWNANNLELVVERGSNISGAATGSLSMNLLSQNTANRTYNYYTRPNAQLLWINYSTSSNNIVINHRGQGTIGQLPGSSLTTIANTTLNQLGSGAYEFSGVNNLLGPVVVDSGEIRYNTNEQTFQRIDLNNLGRINPGTVNGFTRSLFLNGVRQSPRLYGSQASNAQFRSDTLFVPGTTGMLGLKGYLTFITPPVGGRSSLLMATPPELQLYDSTGTLLTGAANTSPVLAFITRTDATNRGRLRGDSLEFMVNDRAVFDSLRLGGRSDSSYRIGFVVDSLVTPVLESENLLVTAGPIFPGLSSVVFSVDTAIANGVDSVIVTVTLSDIDSNFIVNNLVTLSQDSGKVANIIAENNSRSNAQGVARFQVRSTLADSVNFFAFTQVGSDEPFQGTALVYFIPGPPFRLTYINSPYTAASNTVFFPPIQVVIYDSNNNKMWTDTNVVTLSLLPTTFINGSNQATEVKGVATFPIVSIENGGTYIMTATVNDTVFVNSLPFDIIENYYLGGQGDGHNASSAREQTLNGIFVLRIAGDFEANDKLYDGTTTVASNGILVNNLTLSGVEADFPNVSVDTLTYSFLSPSVGDDKRVIISAATLSGADTAEYLLSVIAAPVGRARILGTSHYGGSGRGDVVNQSDTIFLDGVKAIPARFALVEQPGDQLANEAFGLRAQLVTAAGRSVTFGLDTAEISFFANPGSATLGGNVVRGLSGGELVFDDLRINRAGLGYVLNIEPGGVQPYAIDTAHTTALDVYAVYSGGSGRGDTSRLRVSRGLDGLLYDAWVGGASAGPRNWMVADNWSTGLVPRDTSRILITTRPDQPVLQRSAVPAENSFILNSPGLLRLYDNSQLTIDSGTTTAAGPLFRVNAGAEIDTRGNSLIRIYPNARYMNLGNSSPLLESWQRLTGYKGWRLLASPVRTTYADFLDSLESQGFPGSKYDSLQPNILWFAETDTGTTLQSWRQPTNITDSVLLGRGHFVYVFNGAGYPSRVSGGGNYRDSLPLELTTTGREPVIENGDYFTFPELTYTPRSLSTAADTVGGNRFFLDENVADAGWNLLGNPTASVLSWDRGSGAWDVSQIDNTVYIWDPSFSNGMGGYRFWNGNVGNINDTTLASGLIAPYQAFWVHANAPGPILRFNNDAKSDSSQQHISRTAAAPASISLTLQGEGMEANSYVSFGFDGITGPDIFDGYQLEAYNDSWLMLYTNSSVKHRKPLVINHLPDQLNNDLSIPLHISAARNGQPLSGNYSLSWTLADNWPAHWEVALMDHHKQEVVRMQQHNRHQFVYEAPVQATARQGSNAEVFRSPQGSKGVLHTAQNGKNPVFRQQREPERPFTIVIIPNYDGSPIAYRPDHAYLYPPMPNPFGDEATLAFYLPIATEATLEVVDLYGRVVMRQDKSWYSGGTHELQLEGSRLRNGTYVVRLITPDFVSTQKAVRVR